MRILSWRLRTKVLFCAVVAVVSLSMASVASADISCTNTVIWGRKDCVNYISGQARNGNIPTFNNNFFVNKTDYDASFNRGTFQSTMSDRLNKGNTDDVISATVTVDIMLGKPGSDFGGSKAAATAYAVAHFNEWKKMVDDYDKAGLVKWDVAYCPSGNYENASYDDVNDDVWHFEEGPDCIRTIRFDLPDGKSGEPFRIQYGCGNPVGEAGLKPPTPPATGDLNPPTPPNPPNSPGYSEGDSTLQSSCQVISGHAFDPSAPGSGAKVTLTFSTGGPPLTTTASATGAHLFTVNTPDSVRSSLRSVTVTGKVTGSDGTDYDLADSPMTIGPCTILAGSCVNTTTIPVAPDPNTSYSLRATVQYGSSADAIAALAQPDFKFYVTVTGPDGAKVVYNNKNVPGAKQSGNQISVQIDNLPPSGKAGTYDVSWGVTATYGAVDCPGTSAGIKPHAFTSYNKAYFSVTGGDVSVGSAMSPGTGISCSVKKDDDASVVGWSLDPANGDYHGAGTTDAAFALNHIQEFATAQGSTAIPTEPTGLGFANNGLQAGMVNPSAGLYGGKFAGAGCVGNYFANANPSNTYAGQVTLSSLDNFPAGGNIPNGTRLVDYIDGDLLIDSDVKFSGSYGNTGAIPTFAVVVKGNIYIEAGVQQLDGFYISQASTDTSTNGIIYTCAPSGFNTTAANVLTKALQESCKAPLTVNGSFLARQIWLLRTDGNVSTTPAETFNYVPELWLTAPFGSGLSTNYSDYDAISSLPPVL